MKSYELTYIASSQITSNDAENLKKGTEDFVQSKGGLILKSSKTSPQSLAYIIKKNSSGYFATLEFQIQEDKIREIKEKLAKDSNILRHFVIIKKPAKKMKARRFKKSPLILKSETITRSSPVTALKNKEKIKPIKVALEDIEKKLDEILS